ncbi:MAG: ctaG [Rickettsiaceae bacterium]|jgi:cytochrome c oxidase assembly protein subunit 11|nr:ctaG [Rickettsiaceae bacterium]
MQDKFIKDIIYVVVGILLLVFILIQPYNLYCRVKHSCNPITFASWPFFKKGRNTISVNLVANVPKDLKKKVEFYPNSKNIKVQNGKRMKDFYIAKNLTKKHLNVSAHFEISPKKVEKYLHRVECICFKNYSLSPGEQVPMSIDFRISPEIEEDAELKDLKEVIVTYNLYLVK